MLPVALTYTVIAIAVILIMCLLKRCRTLASQRDTLKVMYVQSEDQLNEPAEQESRDTREIYREAYAEAGEHYLGMVRPLQSHIHRLNGYAFRLPSGPNTRVLDTPIGTFAIRTARGYFAETAIFVYFPIGFGFSQEIAGALREATEGRFVMNRAPGSSSGGDDMADAIISAGLDYNAHLRGEQGYFKMSTPPTLDEIVEALSRIIVYTKGVTAKP